MRMHRIQVNTTGVEGSFGIITWEPLPRLKWMQMNWHLSIYIAAIYVLVIFLIQKIMRRKESFRLRRLLATWNTGLSLFSFVGAYVMLNEMYDVMFKGSFYQSVCYSSINESAQHWMWLFALSKVLELGDTLFIVLKKQNLMTLHWCHHFSTLIYTWYSFSQNISLGRWFVTMNFFVHSFMYAYYAFRSLQYKIPRQIAMAITTVQIIQMVLGFYVSSFAFKLKLTGDYCEIPLRTATFGFCVYIAFFFLFVHFFVKSYLSKGKLENSIQNTKKSDQQLNEIRKVNGEIASSDGVIKVNDQLNGGRKNDFSSLTRRKI